MALFSINPSNEELLASYPEESIECMLLRLQEAQKAFLIWKYTPLPIRAQHMKKLAQVLKKSKPEYARLISLEMGKPFSQSLAEIEKCAFACEYYAEHAEAFLKSETVQTESVKSYVSFEPLGLILAIMPWNFPFWQVFRFAVPAIMAGNGVVLKHANNVSGSALAIEKIFKELGFPQNLLSSFICDVEPVAELIQHPLIKGVTLTGSVKAGRQVAALAGAAIKKTVLELGGSDAFLVLEDANLEEAAKIACEARFANAGQVCVCPKRIIVPQKILHSFETLLKTRMEKIVMGDPFDTQTHLGPMARKDLREQLHQQVCESVLKGAQLLLGGEIPNGAGAYYPPTLLTNVRKGMPAYEEELFGPVAVIIPVKNEAEAIKVANDSKYGLGAVIFTENKERGEQIALNELEVGVCYVNQMLRSDLRLPFGGVKLSGYGRELSHYGIREFVNIKSISIV